MRLQMKRKQLFLISTFFHKKSYISSLAHAMHFLNNLRQVTKSTDFKGKKLKSFGSRNTKEPKQNSQMQLRSPISKEGEP